MTYCQKVFFFRKEWCSFHKIPDFSCSRCVKRIFNSAFDWKCAEIHCTVLECSCSRIHRNDRHPKRTAEREFLIFFGLFYRSLVFFIQLSKVLILWRKFNGYRQACLRTTVIGVALKSQLIENCLGNTPDRKGIILEEVQAIFLSSHLDPAPLSPQPPETSYIERRKTQREAWMIERLGCAGLDFFHYISVV